MTKELAVFYIRCSMEAGKKTDQRCDVVIQARGMFTLMPNQCGHTVILEKNNWY